MKVFMLKTAANADGVYQEGREYDLAPELARLWVDRGAAAPVDPVVEVEVIEEAVAAPAPEQAVRRGRPRKS
jgi:hypothetical protein